MEAIVKLLWSFTGVVYSILIVVLSDNHADQQYLDLFTMYMFLFFAACADYFCAKTKALPMGTDYILNSFAYFIQSIIFSYHSFENWNRTRYIDSLSLSLSLVSMACSVTMLLEHKFNRNILLSWVRVLCVFLFGSWLIQCDYIYTSSPPWQGSLILVLAWHCAGLIIFTALYALLWNYLYTYRCRLERGDVDYELLQAPKSVRNREAAVIRLTNLRVSTSDHSDDDEEQSLDGSLHHWK